MMNTAHRAYANQVGHYIPLDESIQTIEDHIAHFFRYMPEEIHIPFPPHLIHPAVALVTRYYRR